MSEREDDDGRKLQALWSIDDRLERTNQLLAELLALLARAEDEAKGRTR